MKFSQFHQIKGGKKQFKQALNSVLIRTDSETSYEKINLEYIPYIESTGTQCIDTNYVVDENDILQLTYELTETSSSGSEYMFASVNGSKYNLLCGVRRLDNQWKICFGKGGVTSYTLETSHESGTLTFMKNHLDVNGSIVGTPSYDGMPVTTLTLFNRKKDTGEYYTGVSMKLYNFTITRDGNLIHEYKPVRRLSDGVLCLYDTVTHQFLTNDGTGDFKTE